MQCLNLSLMRQKRHLHASGKSHIIFVSTYICEWTTSEIQGLQSDYTETLLLLITQFQGKGTITLQFVNCKEINVG